MSRNKAIPQSLIEDPKTGLRCIEAALNRGARFDRHLTRAAHAKLLRLVRAWKDSGPDLLEMKDGSAQLREMWKAWRVRLAPMGHGRAYMYASPTGEKSKDVAAVYFVRLVLNPLCLRLDLCPTCDRWFVRKTDRKSTYCSRGRCAGNAGTARRRAAKLAKKLDQANRAIANYPSRPHRFLKLDCKEWVSQAVSMDKKWVTMQVNRGHLVLPARGTKETAHATR